MTVQHPVHGHLVIAPSAGGKAFELRTRIFIVCQLRFFHELLRVVGSSITAIYCQPDIRQSVVPFRRASVIKPPVVYRPELVGGDELLEALVGWDTFIVALLSGGTTATFVSIREPVRRWAPAIRPFHADPTPDLVAAGVLIERRDSIHNSALPMQI